MAKTRSAYAQQLQLSEAQKKLLPLPVYAIARRIYASLPAYFQEGATETDILSLASLIACCMTLKHPSQIPAEALEQIKGEVSEVVAFIGKYYDLQHIFDERFYQDFACYLYGLNLKKEFNFASDAEKLPESTRIGLIRRYQLAVCPLLQGKAWSVPAGSRSG